MRKIGILTSGGDAPGMNAAVRAVVRSAIYNGLDVCGIYRGNEGLIDGDISEMNISSVSDILHMGGTILRTARSERFMTEEGQKRAMHMLESFGIEGLVVIGGDGSLNGGLAHSQRGIPVMGIPGTIDNDLAYTKYTIGFDTAVNTVLSAISNIRDTSSAHERTTVIEVMGRHCGDIALYAGVAGGAEAILIPELEYNINNICKKIIQGRNRGKLHSIIVKAEGVDIGTSELANKIAENTGLEVKIVVLGYVQRGGAPTARDRVLASVMGNKAVELLLKGSESRAIGVEADEIVHFDLKDALAVERTCDESMLKLADILSI